MDIEIINWAASGLRVYHNGDEYTPEELPDAIVDLLVTILEKWELRNG